MTNINILKRKIKFTKNATKITGALEGISARKLREAEGYLRNTKTFFNEIRALLAKLVKYSLQNNIDSKFIDFNRPHEKVCVVIVGPARGLVGSLVSQQTKFLKEKIELHVSRYSNSKFYSTTINSKAGKISDKCELKNIYHFNTDVENPQIKDIFTLFKVCKDGYLVGSFDRVVLVFPKFISYNFFEFRYDQVLPVNFENKSFYLTQKSNFSLEPNPNLVIDSVIDTFIEASLINAIVNTKCSEYSSRMIAMNKSKLNSKKLTSETTLKYNKERQYQITREVLESTI